MKKKQHNFTRQLGYTQGPDFVPVEEEASSNPIQTSWKYSDYCLWFPALGSLLLRYSVCPTTSDLTSGT